MSDWQKTLTVPELKSLVTVNSYAEDSEIAGELVRLEGVTLNRLFEMDDE